MENRSLISYVQFFSKVIKSKFMCLQWILTRTKQFFEVRVCSESAFLFWTEIKICKTEVIGTVNSYWFGYKLNSSGKKNTCTENSWSKISQWILNALLLNRGSKLSRKKEIQIIFVLHDHKRIKFLWFYILTCNSLYLYTAKFINQCCCNQPHSPLLNELLFSALYRGCFPTIVS
jgi:hypothetical protein